MSNIQATGSIAVNMQPIVAPSHIGPDSVVEYKGLSHWFRSDNTGELVHALDDVSFAVKQNEFCAVVGPSGCGKSTLLNLCAGLSLPTSGSVLFRDKELTALNTEVGYATQNSNLLPWLSVWDNVALPLKIRDIPKDEVAARVEHWLELVGLKGFENAYPKQLSGGMAKRCAIARTLIGNPSVLLMDEPFGALDAITRLIMQDQLLKVWSEQQTTVIFVTHDLTEAIALADRVVVMGARPGSIHKIIDIDLPRPRDVFHISESARFAELHNDLWSVFSDQILTEGAGND